jgi:hypothetical protein
MSKSNAFETQLLEYVFKGTAFPFNAATQLQINLHTADPGEAGSVATNAANYTSYSPVVVSRSGSGFTVAADTVSNAGVISFPTCTGGTNVITHFSVSAVGQSDYIYRGALSAALTVSINVLPQVSIGAFTITEN